ncbi:MOSC domain-containing protein [Hirsutella rhossiliensis]|uniref:MOSC domain-containing protein n=1 Tax=Hirsutella rhossiliensis TaxID=111463 RepID=A0A9P8N6T3_9HYPO|nr:MOSC domain-containing protein [Hirsutella rhossiliensis]KAH0965697.1 MOSC domain-containing protein [Hirsutella rhossiliensis]
MTWLAGAAHLDWGSVFLVALTLVVFFIPVLILFPPIPVERSDALRQTHTKLGLRGPDSNLATQYSPSAHRPRPDARPPTIQSLHVYPVKSCRGVELSHAKVLPTGLENDRLFAFAQLKPRPLAAETDHEPTWEVLTLRQAPLLANVKVDIWLPDPSKTSRQLGKMEEAFLVLRFPGAAGSGPRRLVQLLAAKLSRGLSAVPEMELMLPLDFPSSDDITARGYKYEAVKIWKDTPCALNMERELPPELARYLGLKHPLGLFRMDPANQRQVFRCAPHKDALGYQPVIDFHDAYPLHMLSLTSIRDLETKIQKDQAIQHLDARRFRGNIIISGAEAYDEDDWKSVQFTQPADGRGNETPPSVFDVSCRTVRCKLPNVDPATGIRHRLEPDHALRKHREIDSGAPKAGCLGMQLCPVFHPSGAPEHLQTVLEVGMQVHVLQRGAHYYVGQGQQQKEPQVPDKKHNGAT